MSHIEAFSIQSTQDLTSLLQGLLQRLLAM